MTYALALYTDVQSGAAWVGYLTGVATGWTRTKRLNGGWWQGDFRLYLPDDRLMRWYYNYLGYLVQEKEGGATTWMGYIAEMNLSYHGDTGRRSLDDVYNSVEPVFLDSANSGAQTTGSAVTNAASTARYGTRAYKLDLTDGPQITSTAAGQAATTFLNRSAWPKEITGGVATETGDAEISYLDVTVRGYVDTINWTYVSGTTLDASTGNISAYVSDIFTNDGDQLCKFGAVDTNTLQVKRTLANPTRCWDAIMDAVSLGDASNNMYRAYVVTDRRFFYRQISMTPLYYRFRGKFYNSAFLDQEVSPRQMGMGVVRRLDYPEKRADSGSPFLDSRDFLIDEISVSWDDVLTLNPSTPDLNAMNEAQRRNEYLLEKNEEVKAAIPRKPKVSKKRKAKIMSEHRGK